MATAAATIPMLNPATGQVHAIPTNMVDRARAAGGKPVATVRDPRGTLRYVPMDQVQAAQRAGGTLIPYGSQSSQEVAQDATGIHPYTNPIMQGLAGLGRVIAAPFKLPGQIYDAATSPAATPEEKAAQEGSGSLGLVGERMIAAPARAAHQTAEQLRQAGHPFLAAGAELGALPLLGAQGQNLGRRAAAGDVTGAVTEGLATAIGPKALKDGAAAVAEPLATALQDSATGTINKGVIGARSADFNRGANPGRAFIENNLGPSASMESIADKAAEARSNIGQQLGNAYSDATAAGKKIPVRDVWNAIQPIIDQARTKATGPGVLADPTVYDQLYDSFVPELQAASRRGGLTPSELWAMRKNMNESLNWADQSKLNVTKTQQRISGALGGLLEDNVPAVGDLNQMYADAVSLADRTAERAKTGSSSLHGAMSKGAASVAGAIAGKASGLGVAGELGGAALGAALDSVPAKTALAAGTAAASKLVGPAATVAPAAAVPAMLAQPAAASVPEDPGNEEDREGGNGTAGQTTDVSNQTVQGAPAGKSIDPQYTPETHNFSGRQWSADNPDGDPDEAREEAASLGFTVTD